ncbi:desulfoferrodoxin [Candidatus Bathyarchaeota archaeon ex4484_231]|nr:MAG: desulfoferrodoxin [Candidatus Bathyarchaeota archaeon ex4484_231]RLG91293.1 MAG: desulfoferrodoxin [Candidatus Bathyarchaeota archaeon]
MAELKQVYRCNICGNIVEVLHAGSGQLVCCGQPMELLTEKTEDVGKEKHVPVVEMTADGFKVKVGSIEHPMEENHYIEWIELIADDKVYRRFLKPGEKPEAEFKVKAEQIQAREYCNVHGLWSVRKS